MARQNNKTHKEKKLWLIDWKHSDIQNGSTDDRLHAVEMLCRRSCYKITLVDRTRKKRMNLKTSITETVEKTTLWGDWKAAHSLGVDTTRGRPRKSSNATMRETMLSNKNLREEEYKEAWRDWDAVDLQRSCKETVLHTHQHARCLCMIKLLFLGT